MIPKTSDGRVLFAVPWHDKIVVGTTDTLKVIV
jgi:glycerol-3-phosphate dehydrogenase